MYYDKTYDEHFPAFIQNEEIHICLNIINTKLLLKENLDRELAIYFETRRPTVDI